MIGGDNVFATLGWASPLGTLTGFAYLVDQDVAAVQGFRLSSQTYGVRLAGNRRIGRALVAWQASLCVIDLHRNPNDYAASYWLADVVVDLSGPRLGGGYEVLGADDGRAFTSFQTPLAAVFKFNGWAERFTPKPPDGLRDLYASAGWGWETPGPAKAVALPESGTGSRATGWCGITATSWTCSPRRGSGARWRACDVPIIARTASRAIRASCGRSSTGRSDLSRMLRKSSCWRGSGGGQGGETTLRRSVEEYGRRGRCRTAAHVKG
ncbi:hypothetical protein AB5I41_27045 [Sphingomonas sp. MMS24-JH45]